MSYPYEYETTLQHLEKGQFATIKKVRTVYKTYFADYCQLTKRLAFSNKWLEKVYNPNYTGLSKSRQRKYAQTQYPKWSRYAFRKTCYPFNNPLNLVPVYDRQIFLFAIQNRETKKIIHACIKRPEDSTKIYHYPHAFFPVKDCLIETFSKYGLPYYLVSDGSVLQQNKEILKPIRFKIKAKSPRMINSLESFFARITYEMREDLTQTNLDRYVRWHNETRAENFEENLSGKTEIVVYEDKSFERQRKTKRFLNNMDILDLEKNRYAKTANQCLWFPKLKYLA